MSLLTVSHLSAGYGRKKSYTISALRRVPEQSPVFSVQMDAANYALKAIANILPHKGSCLLAENTLESLSARELAKQCGYIPQKAESQLI